MASAALYVWAIRFLSESISNHNISSFSQCCENACFKQALGELQSVKPSSRAKACALFHASSKQNSKYWMHPAFSKSVSAGVERAPCKFPNAFQNRPGLSYYPSNKGSIAFNASVFKEGAALFKSTKSILYKVSMFSSKSSIR